MPSGAASMTQESNRRSGTAKTQKLRRLDDAPSPAARRMLVIDDDDGQRRATVAAFTAAGWTVADASDLKGAMDLAMNLQPALIVTELALPDTRGFQFARALRSAVEHDVHLVAVTRQPESLFEEALGAGFDAVLAKPASVDAVERVLGAARRR
jgi:CheY-like chemotaxis protein